MKQRWKVLLVTSVAVFMGFLDVTIVNIAFPDIEASFPGTSLAGLSWILNAYNIVFAALLVPAGRLADRLGRRRMFFVGVSTFLAASVGVRAGAVGRGARRRAASCRPRAPRSSSRPRWRCCCPSSRSSSARPRPRSGARPAASRPRPAPRSAACSSTATSWRWVFFVNLAIGLPALIPARRLLRETPRASIPARCPTSLGIVLLVAGVGLLSLGIVKGQDWGWGSPPRGRVARRLRARARRLRRALGAPSGAR